MSSTSSLSYDSTTIIIWPNKTKSVIPDTRFPCDLTTVSTLEKDYQLAPTEWRSIAAWIDKIGPNYLLYELGVPSQESHFELAFMTPLGHQWIYLEDDCTGGAVSISTIHGCAKDSNIILYTMIALAQEPYPIAHFLTNTRASSVLARWFSSIRARYELWEPDVIYSGLDPAEISAIEAVFPHGPRELCSWQVYETCKRGFDESLKETIELEQSQIRSDYLSILQQMMQEINMREPKMDVLREQMKTALKSSNSLSLASQHEIVRNTERLVSMIRDVPRPSFIKCCTQVEPYEMPTEYFQNLLNLTTDHTLQLGNRIDWILYILLKKFNATTKHLSDRRSTDNDEQSYLDSLKVSDTSVAWKSDTECLVGHPSKEARAVKLKANSSFGSSGTPSYDECQCFTDECLDSDCYEGRGYEGHIHVYTSASDGRCEHIHAALRNRRNDVREARIFEQLSTNQRLRERYGSWGVFKSDHDVFEGFVPKISTAKDLGTFCNDAWDSESDEEEIPNKQKRKRR